VTGGKPIAFFLQSISGGSAINPLVAFYDIHGGKIEVLFFYFVPDTTRDICRKQCDQILLSCVIVIPDEVVDDVHVERAQEGGCFRHCHIQDRFVHFLKDHHFGIG
jgi:hypothetical protein